MKKHFRQILSILLAVAVLLSLLPASVGANAPEMPDYAQADEIFAGLYRRLQSRKASMDDAERAEAASAYIEQADGVKPGTVRRRGNALTWETKDGVACHFSPHLYELMTEGANADRKDNDSRKTMELTMPEVKSPEVSGRDVYLFAPYYELDNSFEGVGGSYDSWGGILAHFTGGNYYRYEREKATIDALANALEDSAVVLIDSHGNTDTGDSYDPTSSYICLQSGAGITAADYAYDPIAGVSHAYYGGTSGDGKLSYYEVDGTAIANHMDRDASNNLFWNATCYGMATDGICAPLAERGVAVIYGYSQEVSFGGDQYWMETVMDELTNAGTFHEAVAEMKRVCGAWDYSKQICEYNSWSSFWINHTAADAVKNIDAFPVVVSAQDAYPEDPDALQTVKSQWQLPRLELRLEFQLPDGVLASDVQGYVFYEGTLPTPAGKPRDKTHSYEFEGWCLQDFPPVTAVPYELFAPGRAFSFGYYDVKDPLCFGDHSAILYGVYSYRDGETVWYTTQVPDGTYDPYDPSAIFTDMPYGSWYYDSVRFAVAQELVKGYPDDTFRPNDTLRRSEVVSVLYRAAGSPEVDTVAAFDDVPADAWYSDALAWAVENHIVKGVAERTFAPDQRVSRAQLAALFYRYAQAEHTDITAISAFPDAGQVPGWAQKEMAWAVETGLINGSRIQGTDYLQPGALASRAQFVTILERYLTD